MVFEEEQAEKTVETHEEQPIVVNEGVINSPRQRYVSTRLASHEVIPYGEVNDERDFVHFALLIDSQHVNYEIALSDKVSRNFTIEEFHTSEILIDTMSTPR
jgi:hypothetical protein